VTGTSTRGGLILVLTLIAYAVLAFGYVTVTPIWQNPDEPAHYNYVAFVAQTGGLPELKPGDWDSALLERLAGSRANAGGVRFTSIIAGSDNIVIPRVFAAGDDPVYVPDLGHLGMLFSPAVFRAVADRLLCPKGLQILPSRAGSTAAASPDPGDP